MFQTFYYLCYLGIFVFSFGAGPKSTLTTFRPLTLHMHENTDFISNNLTFTVIIGMQIMFKGGAFSTSTKVWPLLEERKNALANPAEEPVDGAPLHSRAPFFEATTTTLKMRTFRVSRFSTICN